MQVESTEISQSIIGVISAILGNIGISIALNVQKYAHNRIKRKGRCEGLQSNDCSSEEERSNAIYQQEQLNTCSLSLEEMEQEQINWENRTLSGLEEESANDLDADANYSYLSSKLWWLGFFIMICGELGNFAAYGFAPAVLVAPLGTVSLISNIIIAPLFLGERIRKEDIFGIACSILGTFIILAVSSSTNEPTLNVDDILMAISQLNFLIFFGISVILLLFLYRLSISELGAKYSIIDLLIAGILGGYTVLSIKAISSLLKLNVYIMLSHWITYVIIMVLILTGIFQIHFLNKTLSRFNAVEVIPTNFVLFTTCSIIASSIMYNDLSRTSPFALLGVFFMFLGVIMITLKHQQPAGYTLIEESLISDQATHVILPHVMTSPALIPSSNMNFLSSPQRETYYNSSRRLSSISFDHNTNTNLTESAYRRVSGILTSVGSSVGTHSVRKIEFDYLASVSGSFSNHP